MDIDTWLRTLIIAQTVMVAVLIGWFVCLSVGRGMFVDRCRRWCGRFMERHIDSLIRDHVPKPDKTVDTLVRGRTLKRYRWGA